jgi:hypothetical protein
MNFLRFGITLSLGELRWRGLELAVGSLFMRGYYCTRHPQTGAAGRHFESALVDVDQVSKAVPLLR